MVKLGSKAYTPSTGTMDTEGMGIEVLCPECLQRTPAYPLIGTHDVAWM